jgi:sugar lactone lactonase YvrE
MPRQLRPTRFVAGFVYGEGPRWHDGRLWFTDGPSGHILTVDDAGQLTVEVETEHPSGLGWLPDGTLIVCTMRVAQIKSVSPTRETVLHDLTGQAWSTNDIVVGPGGLGYVDIYHLTDDGSIRGELGALTPDGALRIVASDLATPNGLGITPDGSTLVVSETFGNRLLAFTIQPGGSLTDRRVFAELDGGRCPDGLCFDAEGAVWVASFNTGEFLRILEGGAITDRVEVDGGWAVAPALGGDDRRTLYLIVNDTSYERQASNDSHGRIDRVRVDVPGAGWP